MVREHLRVHKNRLLQAPLAVLYILCRKIYDKILT